MANDNLDGLVSDDIAAEDKGILGHAGLMLAVTFVALGAIVAGQLRNEGLFEDPDSLLRMVSVRDLMAGQGWFDTIQSRVLPPEGLHLHWSRMLDAVLAGLVYLFSAFLPRATAEEVVMALWPVFLLVVFTLVLGALVRGRFGVKAASLTMLAAALLQLPRGFYFKAGEVDHHNLQLVLMAACGWAVIADANKAKAGFAAGAAMALSLAIGLEGVGFFAVTLGFLAVRFILAGEWEAERLGAFGLGLALVSPLLFVVQTPFSEWAVMRCDVVAPPGLAITTAIGIGSVLLVRLTRGAAPLRRGVVALALAVLALAALAPVLTPCRGGPYNMVSSEVQRIVIANVLENRPIPFFFEGLVVQGAQMVLPFVAALVMLAPTLGPGPQRDARIYLFAVVAFGLAVGFIQARMMIWGWALLPAALGVVFADFVRSSRINLFWGLRLLLVMCAIFPYSVGLAILFLRAGDPSVAMPDPVTSREEYRCASRSALEPLNQLAPAIIFNPIETAPALLFYTHHSVTGASYHRSPKALETGVLPFLSPDENVLRTAVAETNADYILLCKGRDYGAERSIGTRLSRGERPGWLTETPLEGADRLIILKVAKPLS